MGSRSSRSCDEKVEECCDEKHDWLYNDQDSASDCESNLCPCVVYGRCKLRLKEAADFGLKDGKKIRNGSFETQQKYYSKLGVYPTFTKSCCTFAACCFPFYGGFISTLRGQVRRFYNIDGSSGGYTPEPPMSSSSSSSSSGANNRTTTPDTEHDEPLPCIPEDSSEASATTHSDPSSRRSSKTRERSIAQDPVAPTDETLVHNHDLAKDPKAAYKTNKNHNLGDDTSTPTYPPSIHQLRADIKARASPPAVHKHNLSHDASVAYPAESKNHDIGFDEVKTFVPQRAKGSEHDLHQDKTTPGSYPDTSTHNLHDDMVSRPTASPRPHMLEADEEVLSRATIRGPHRLNQEQAHQDRQRHDFMLGQ
ncbi:hypothetical protein FSARC_9055 [Fusarium sarcochroum]|uniref:Uncharacterized protein n=1 Tax=Fusarium sarcochroum TaxID=1208366 RepID=A0A8H4X6H9_9HYPO|nr:hypothetical protein FSARC_9055 [Fusarium sarcochroum]